MLVLVNKSGRVQVTTLSCITPWAVITFRAEKRSAQASAHPLSQAQGGLFLCVDWVCLLFVAGVE